MIKIAYTIDDIWVVGLFLDESHIQTQTYIDITNMDMPSSPPETWDYIDGDDGDIKAYNFSLGGLSQQDV